MAIEKLLFGGAFGHHWAGVYEYLSWTRHSSTSKQECARMEMKKQS